MFNEYAARLGEEIRQAMISHVYTTSEESIITDSDLTSSNVDLIST
jgi:hypothetical protein